MISKIDNRIDLRKKTFWILAVFILLLLFSYIYLVNLTVVNAVSVKDSTESTQELTASINMLEARYLATTKGFGVDEARLAGFVEFHDPVFVMVGQSEVGLSLHDAR